MAFYMWRLFLLFKNVLMKSLAGNMHRKGRCKLQAVHTRMRIRRSRKEKTGAYQLTNIPVKAISTLTLSMEHSGSDANITLSEGNFGSCGKQEANLADKTKAMRRSRPNRHHWRGGSLTKASYICNVSAISTALTSSSAPWVCNACEKRRRVSCELTSNPATSCTVWLQIFAAQYFREFCD